jgi:tRNA-2-methylthio-N6-dimethylallyladenosine synthase
VADYLAKVEAVRSFRPDIALSTDFIVGFPGETEDDFRRTIDVMNTVRYDFCFSFKYSPRSGTAAASLPGAPSLAEADERLQRLLALQDIHTAQRLGAMVGKTVEVLVEKPSSRDASRLFGRTGCFKAVNFAAKSGSNADPFRRVVIAKAGSHSLSGEEA